MSRSTSTSKLKKIRLPWYAAAGALAVFSELNVIENIPSNLNWTLSVYYDYDLLFGLLAFLLLIMMSWTIFSLTRTPSFPPLENDVQDDSDSLTSPAERSLGRTIMISGLSVIVAFTWAALALSFYASNRALPAYPETYKSH